MNKLSMSELIEFILESIQLVKRRCSDINYSDDFLSNDTNLDKFEASIMRIQAMGEALKNIEKRDKENLLSVAPKEYWSEIIKMRDLISHHYIDIQADIVFELCKNELDELNKKILKLKEINK